MKKINFIISFCCLITIFCAFYQYSFIEYLDTGIRSLLFNARNDFLNYAVLAFTHVGDAAVLGTICLLGTIVLFFYKKWINGFLLLSSLTVTFGLNKLIKNAFERERPLEHRLLDEDGFSFPSGNAMVGTSFYLFAAFILYQKFQKPWILWVGTIFPFLLGISRIYIGVHYPSDILAGFCIGVLCCLGLIGISTFYGKVKQKSVQNKNTAI
ncbi:phosphatase PAP2 family protein [Bacillus sp. NEB1478]|uniref:phosphatase PAP2 family protein n=1 Tax=Bacillus sp. NEB1478 TaxID=3073816 RepID=UPI002873ED0C|nr:phosphatase PAP2 family protein [Bacillus sp. NEB1478]WNB93777.1 phosphatase PAP2 family protein [Bacillus sp. NEB1478]